MKIGPFCGFSLPEIISIKQKEQEKIGKFYLGYSGVFCHPKRVSEFIQNARNQQEKIMVLFTTTPSNFNSPIARLSHESHDAQNWTALPEEVLLVGSKFSIVAKNIQPTNFDLDLSQYESMLGTTPGKTLDEYLRFRCDKACAVHKESRAKTPRIAKISYTCELENCVYVK